MTSSIELVTIYLFIFFLEFAMAKLSSNPTTQGRNNNFGKAQAPVVNTKNSDFNQAPPTVWSSLTPVDLITPDAYGGKSSGTHGTATKTHDLNAGGLLDAWRKGGLKGLLPRIKDIQGKIKEGIEFARNIEKAIKSGGKPLDRVANVLGVTAAGIGSITGKGGLLASIIGGEAIENSVLGKITGDTKFLLKIGEGLRTVSNTDFSDLQQVAGLLNKLGDGAGPMALLSDPTVKALFGADIVTRMQNMGIGGMVRDVASMLDESGIFPFIHSIFPNAIKAGDLAGIQQILQLLGRGKFNSMQPGFHNAMSAGFTLDGINAGRLPQNTYPEIRTIFSDINPEWGRVPTTGAYAIEGTKKDVVDGLHHMNLVPIMNGSKDFKKVWYGGAKESDDIEMQMTQLSEVFKPQSVHQTLKEDYPYLVLKEQTENLVDYLF